MTAIETIRDVLLKTGAGEQYPEALAALDRLVDEEMLASAENRELKADIQTYIKAADGAQSALIALREKVAETRRETLEEVKKFGELQSCGHPKSAIYSGEEGTNHCTMCAKMQEQALKAIEGKLEKIDELPDVR